MTKLEIDFVLGTLLVSLLVVAVHSSAAPHELKKMAGGVRKKCLTESGTTADIVDEAEIGNFSGDNELKCYFKCVLERFNMFSKSDKLNFNLMKKIVPEHFKDIGYEMIDSCTEISGSNRCEIAYNFMTCLYNANPVAFFVV